jgi:hypothetical protein
MSSLGSELHEPAAPLSDIVAMDAAALTAAIHARDVSCVEVMTAYLDHIERLNPKINAIVALQDRAALLAQARGQVGEQVIAYSSSTRANLGVAIACLGLPGAQVYPSIQ